MRLGLDADQFWRLTPRLMQTIALATAHGAVRDHNDRAWLAWNIAALSRTKKLPKLQSLQMKLPKAKRRQTLEEMREAVRLIATIHGAVKAKSKSKSKSKK